MYNVKDNAEGQLQVGLSSQSTTLVVQAGHTRRFPAVPFLAVLNKRNNKGEITKTETIAVTEVIGDQWTIERWLEGTSATDFSTNDFVSIFVLARHIQDLQAYADNVKNASVSKKSNEQINGVKTFIQTPLSSGTVTEWAHLTTKDYVDAAIRKQSLVTKLSEQIYPLWEDVYKNDILFVECIPTADEATDELKIWADEASKMVAIPLISSGEEGSSITLPIKKIGNPSTHLVMELRTDNNGQPSDTLYNANARISLAPSEITTNKTTITANFQWDFPAPEQGQRLRLVIYQQDKVVNTTNYYSLYMAPTNTTTRPYSLLQEWQWVSQKPKPNTKNYNFGGRHTWSESRSTYNGTRVIFNVPFVQLKAINKISTCTATSVRVRKWSTVLGTYQFQWDKATLNPPLTLEGGTEYIMETYNNGKAYMNMRRDNRASLDNVRVVWGIEDVRDVAMSVNIQSIDMEYLQVSSNFVSLSSSLCINRVLSKASAGATHTLPIDIVRIAQQSWSVGELIPVSYYGQHSGISLQAGQKYYLSNMPGLISSIGEYEIGVAINDTTLYTTWLSGKLYQYSSKITTVKQSHTHPLIRHAKKVVIVYDGYEYERMKRSSMTVSYSRWSTATDLSTATINWNNDTIDFITTHTLHNGSNISFTFYV